LILAKYLGGANRANFTSAVTSQVKSFLQQYLWTFLKAKKDDGCNVIGYTAWSMIVNFEWNSVYTEVMCVCYVSFSYSEFKITIIIIITIIT
jgi:beta-glucosidase/6-phospho-beta-glucosidase/beta-galactosidase